MKKLISIFMAFILVITNSCIVYAADDTTPPIIVDMKWSATELKIGEVLEIEIEAYDNESGIKYDGYYPHMLIRNNKTGLYIDKNLSYDEVSGNLKVQFEMNPNMQSGEWELGWIVIQDNVGNEKMYQSYDFDKEYKFTLIDGIKDIVAPKIVDMKWSAAELKIGDVLEVEIEAYDNESGIKYDGYYPHMLIRNNKTGLYIDKNLSYDEVSGNLKVQFEMNPNMQSGEWELGWIVIQDNVGNEKMYQSYDFDKEYKFTLIDGIKDIVAPKIVDMKWSAAELKIGDVLEVEIEAYDNESGIKYDGYYPHMLVRNNKTGLYINKNLSYDEVSGKLRTQFEMNPNMQSGEWELGWIVIQDNVGNEKMYQSYDFDTEYKFNLISSFVGSDNKSIKKGDKFEPLKDVSVTNNIDGDFTDRITYSGSIDVNSEGIYLIKYEAVGNSGYTYIDYRWITVVNNIITDEDGNEEVYFNNNISLNLSEIETSGSMVITKDGEEYSLSENKLITEEGVYNISFNNLMKSNEKQSDNELQFIIDKTAPQILSVKDIEVIEDEKRSAGEFVLATDKNNKVYYSFVNEPNWSKVGVQKVKIVISDAAGNSINKEISINILDKCDIDKSGQVDINDIAKVSVNYNISNEDIKYDKRMDINKDGVIDIFDLVYCSIRL